MSDKHLQIEEEREIDKIKTVKELEEIMKKESNQIEAIKRGLKERESRAKKIKDVFGVYKGWLGNKKKLTNFKEPCLILMRNNMSDEFYEDASKGRMTYTHSNGETQYLILDPRYLRSLPFGDKVMRYYLCHEDYPLPLPEDPALSAEKFNMAIERISSIEKEYRAKELKWKGEMWWKILTGIAIVIGAIALANMIGAFDWVARWLNRNDVVEETGRVATVVGSILIGRFRRLKND